jgi:hypothetical protein
MKGYTAIAGWVKVVPPPVLADLYLRAGRTGVTEATRWAQPVHELAVSPFSASPNDLEAAVPVNGYPPGSCQNCHAGRRVSVVGRPLEIAPFLTAMKEAGDCNSGAVNTFCRVTSVRSLA